jgi:hypothetical protein
MRDMRELRRQSILDEHQTATSQFEEAVTRWHDAECYIEQLEAEVMKVRRGYLDDVSGGYIRLRPSRRVDALKLDTLAPIGSNLDVAHG